MAGFKSVRVAGFVGIGKMVTGRLFGAARPAFFLWCDGQKRNHHRMIDERLEMNASSKPKPSAVDFALAHIRASSGIVTDAESFGRCLASGIVEPSSQVAIETHLREAAPAELADLVAEGRATFQSLAALADRLIEPDHPNAEFIHEAAV